MSNNIRYLSNAIRFLSMDAVEKAKSGHPGMPMGMADVVTILFKYYLKFNPKNPSWIIEIGLFFQLVMALCFYILFYI